MKTHALVFLLTSLCLFSTGMQAQDRAGRAFNEVYASAGVVPGGTVVPWFEAMYTHGWYVGSHFGAGISAGYSFGAAALLTAKGFLPIGKEDSFGLYLQASGGSAFYPSVLPLLSGSGGCYFRLKNGNRVNLGPFVTYAYGLPINKTEAEPSGAKAWHCRLLGLRIGFQF